MPTRKLKKKSHARQTCRISPFSYIDRGRKKKKRIGIAAKDRKQRKKEKRSDLRRNLTKTARKLQART